MTLLSVVIPCHNEAGNIGELHRRLDAALAPWKGDCEFIFVDDGSTDQTLAVLRELAAADGRVRVLSLSRNFGHQAALTAGIDHAGGQAVIAMDADLQHPPETIPELVAHWQAGYDLVYAYRQGVRTRLGYRIINRLVRPTIPPEAADFRLMSRAVAEAFRRMPERTRFIRGMIAWLGFKQTGIPYQQDRRFAGTRAYTRRQTARMALNAVLAFSSIPLRLASLLGGITLLAGVFYAVFIGWAWFTGRPIEPGWTGLMLTVLILGGVQLISLGVIAEYIGCMYEEVKQRPVYVVRERIGPSLPASPNSHEAGGSRPTRTPA